MDVHVPWPLTDQLRRRDLSVMTAQEDEATRFQDDEWLARAREIGRVLFTQDIRFRVLAEEWQRTGRPFSGLVFGHPLRGTIGKYVFDIELIAKATDPEDWENQIEQLPL
jgi:hypothetical protein